MYKETYQKEEVKDIMQDIIMRIEDEARYHGRLGGEKMEYAFRKRRTRWRASSPRHG